MRATTPAPGSAPDAKPTPTAARETEHEAASHRPRLA